MFRPGGDLLSHGETPHYHRHYGVSLLSSAWGQVGPPHYRRRDYSSHLPLPYIRDKGHISHSHRNNFYAIFIFSFFISYFLLFYFLLFFFSFLFLTFFFFLFYFFFFSFSSYFFLFLLSSTKTSRPLLFLHPLSSILPYKTLERCMVKPLGQLVCVSSTAHTAYTPHLSTSSSTTTLTDSKSGMTHLKASFVLRCFQHLSLPHLATRQCNRHYNRNTSDASTPVLSY